jgi:adenosylhomocysteine nucleosidase
MTAKPLIVMALESESQGRIEMLGHTVLYCGVGKVNAAYQLTRALHATRASNRDFSYVLNLGSAGSSRFARGTVVAASQFLQRDMDATGLGFLQGETPFDALPRMITATPLFPHLPHGLCSSGDAFLQGPCPVQGEIIDMEAYALAKVCQYEQIPFACVKYITDGADASASGDWEANLAQAAEALHGVLASL